MSRRRRCTWREVAKAAEDRALSALRWVAYVVCGAGILVAGYALGLTVKAILGI